MAGHTPGPWRWELNEKSKRVQMCGGRPRYDLIVMDFVRWGLNNAAPRFQTGHREGLNVMHRCDEHGAVAEGREHHAAWFKAIDHPDARLIAAAPDLLDACRAMQAFLADLDRHDGLSADAHRIVDMVDAAIAKATGDHPA